MKRAILTIFALILGFPFLTNASGERKDFYKYWYHVKSMVIFDKKHPLYDPFFGIHHVYINKKGLKTIQSQGKRTFPEGTKIAIVFYNHKEDQGAFVEGEKRLEAYMIKNSKKYKNTDGWGYFAYDAKGNPIVKDMKVDCHNCHSQVKDQDFVFSLWKE